MSIICLNLKAAAQLLYHKTRNFGEWKLWRIWQIRIKSPNLNLSKKSHQSKYVPLNNIWNLIRNTWAFTVNFQLLLWYVHVEKIQECVLQLCHFRLSVWWLPQQEDYAYCPLHVGSKFFSQSWNLPYNLIYMKPTNHRRYWKAKHYHGFPHVSRTWLHVTSIPNFPHHQYQHNYYLKCF